MSGQSITDRITAAQHSVTGSAVSKTVCKATTHEVMGPKKKHLDCECPGLGGGRAWRCSGGSRPGGSLGLGPQHAYLRVSPWELSGLLLSRPA